MNKKFSNRQRSSFFIMNLSAFAVIFVLLGAIILQLLNQTAFQETDQTLREMSQQTEMIEQEVSRYQNGFWNVEGELKTPMEPPRSPSSNRFNTQIILWSASGEILNREALGGRFSELENLHLMTDNLDTIQSLTVEGEEELLFHSITQAYNEGEVAYVQIVSNVNQIQHSLRNFRWIVIICMVIFWLISIGVSYWLSALSMKPILKAWQKQQEFVENASHELRTPLTIIQNRLEGLFRKPNQTIIEGSENIAQALNETRRLTGLTSDLLTIARSDANQLTLDKSKQDTADFLREVITPFQEIAELEEKEFTIELETELEANFDTKKIHQVMVILLDNALKYTQAQEAIKIQSVKKKKLWEIHVINTGPTISETGKAHLFDRFYREDKSRSKETGGYGLGLAIAKQIVEEHQGKIFVTDVLPQGADFCLQLPIQ